MEIHVENIKCGGCKNTISKAILAIEGTNNVQIDLKQEIITLEANEDLRPAIVAKLHQLGYPEAGKNSIIEKAKSYVSCAVGKISS